MEEDAQMPSTKHQAMRDAAVQQGFAIIVFNPSPFVSQ